MKTVNIKNKAVSKAGIKTTAFGNANALVWNSKRRFV